MPQQQRAAMMRMRLSEYGVVVVHVKPVYSRSKSRKGLPGVSGVSFARRTAS
jgi:hypothetical protein